MGKCAVWPMGEKGAFDPANATVRMDGDLTLYYYDQNGVRQSIDSNDSRREIRGVDMTRQFSFHHYSKTYPYIITLFKDGVFYFKETNDRDGKPDYGW